MSNVNQNAARVPCAAGSAPTKHESQYALSIQRVRLAADAWFNADTPAALEYFHAMKAAHRAAFGDCQKREGVWS